MFQQHFAGAICVGLAMCWLAAMFGVVRRPDVIVGCQSSAHIE